MQQAIPSTDRWLALTLGLFVLAVYLATTSLQFHMIDEVAVFSAMRSLAGRGTLDSDAIYWTYAPLGRGSITGLGTDGHWYATKDLSPLLLGTPLVWLAHRIGTSPVRAAHMLMPLTTAVTTGLLYRVVRSWGYERITSSLGALTFGLASMAWPYALMLFTQPMAALGMLAALYGATQAYASGNWRAALIGGLGLGLAGTSSAVTWATGPLYLLYLIPWERLRGESRHVAGARWVRCSLALGAGAGVFAVAQMVYNVARFGSPLLTGHQQFGGANFRLYYFGLGSYGQLFSTPRGVIWYAPFVLLIPFGLWIGWRTHRRNLLLALGQVVIVFSVYSTYFTWWAGHVWGPRYLVPVMPSLTLLAVPALDRLLQPSPLWARLLAALVWITSLITQLMATLFNYLYTEVDISYGLHLITPPPSLIVRAPILTDLRALPFLRQIAAARAAQWDVVWMSSGHPDWLLLVAQIAVIGLGAFWTAQWVWMRESNRAKRGVGFQIVLTAGLALFMLLRYPNSAEAMPGMEALVNAVQDEAQAGDGIVAILPYSAFDWLDRFDASIHDIGLVFENPLSQETANLLTHTGEWHDRVWVITEGTTRGDPANGAERWLAEHAYVGMETWVEGYRIVPYTFGSMAQLEPVSVPFGNGEIALTGYSVELTRRPSGGWINVALRWGIATQSASTHTVFVHLLDGSGALLAQHDGPLLAGYTPPGGWLSREPLIDRRSVALPASLGPGDYQLAIGLYHATTGIRLPLADGPGDTFLLETITIP